MAERKRGGARPGAGRKPGAANKKTREIADKASEGGITPLEVMLKAMTELVTQADKIKVGESAEIDGKKMTRIGLLISAADVAKDAAPYMHPRLQSVELTGKGGGPVQQVNMTPAEMEAATESAMNKLLRRGTDG